jgi:hypothetical protein
MRSNTYSLPLKCTRASAPDNIRFGQGREGYDTSHDTKSDRLKLHTPSCRPRVVQEARGVD